jgi:hypothetical protein
MRVAGHIGKLVMHAVSGHPEDRAAFQRHRAEGGKDVFHPERNLIRAVRVQPVITHADPEPDRDVVKHGRHGEGLPTEHEQGGNGPDMQEY